MLIANISQFIAAIAFIALMAINNIAIYSTYGIYSSYGNFSTYSYYSTYSIYPGIIDQYPRLYVRSNIFRFSPSNSKTNL